MAVSEPPFLGALLIQFPIMKTPANNLTIAAPKDFQLHASNQRVSWHKIIALARPYQVKIILLIQPSKLLEPRLRFEIFTLRKTARNSPSVTIIPGNTQVLSV